MGEEKLLNDYKMRCRLFVWKESMCPLFIQHCRSRSLLRKVGKEQSPPQLVFTEKFRGELRRW
jgi:hypothetical protein